MPEIPDRILREDLYLALGVPDTATRNELSKALAEFVAGNPTRTTSIHPEDWQRGVPERHLYIQRVGKEEPQNDKHLPQLLWSWKIFIAEASHYYEQIDGELWQLLQLCRIDVPLSRQKARSIRRQEILVHSQVNSTTIRACFVLCLT